MTTEKNDILVTVIIVNYNALSWLKRCYESLAEQTIASRLQIIFIDNISADGSDKAGEELTKQWANGLYIQMGFNAGFGRACNRAVKEAKGKYLFLLNPDIWLERDCIEQLVTAAEREQAAMVGPLVYNYDDNSFQNNGGDGFDMFGFVVWMGENSKPKRLICANGFIFIRKEVYLAVGGEDEAFFLYNEECDLSWRVLLAGHDIAYTPAAHIHHRGAVSVNPGGGTKIVELRTSYGKRFYANRNHLLNLLKNSQHILLLMVIPSICLMFVEGLVGIVLSRRGGYFKRTFWDVLIGCWQLRGHVVAERRRMRTIRKRGDFWMLRFFTFRLNRWDEVKRILKLGPPILDPR